MFLFRWDMPLPGKDVEMNPNDTEESLWAFLCEAQTVGDATWNMGICFVSEDGFRRRWGLTRVGFGCVLCCDFFVWFLIFGVCFKALFFSTCNSIAKDLCHTVVFLNSSVFGDSFLPRFSHRESLAMYINPRTLLGWWLHLLPSVAATNALGWVVSDVNVEPVFWFIYYSCVFLRILYSTAPCGKLVPKTTIPW